MSSFAVALCAPSGTGKTTVARALVEKSESLVFSISATTRSMRPGEQEGVDYHFVSRAEFEEMIADGAMLEWAVVHGELYGTPRANLEEADEQGANLLLDIDVQGAKQVAESLPDTVTIFLLPPSSEALKERLRRRGSENSDELRTRFETAQRELDAMDEFQHVLVNDRLEDTVAIIQTIIAAERHRLCRRREELEELRDALKRDLGADEA